MATYTKFSQYQLHDAWNIDPTLDIELTEEQRETMNDEARAHFFTEADKILEPYGFSLHATGEIIGEVGTSNLEDEEWDDLKIEISSIDFDDIVEKYLDIAANQN